jgi:hypothetical protein
MSGTVFTAAAGRDRKKLSRSCETLRKRMGTTMLSLPGVKNPPDATMA